MHSLGLDSTRAELERTTMSIRLFKALPSTVSLVATGTESAKAIIDILASNKAHQGKIPQLKPPSTGPITPYLPPMIKAHYRCGPYSCNRRDRQKHVPDTSVDEGLYSRADPLEKLRSPGILIIISSPHCSHLLDPMRSR